MNRSCLNHLLTETEREQFAKNGYLIIENALTPETLDICLAAVDRIDLQIRKELNYELDKRINVHDCIGKETDLLQLIDLPTTFPKVWGLIGWNIYLFHTQMIALYGAPDYIRSDNGSEFIAHKVQQWLKKNGIKTIYIDPGSPWQNGYIESFHARLRDECLDREILLNVREAQVVLEDFRQHYNWHRPHSRLNYKSPEVFILKNFKSNLSHKVA